MDKEKTYDDDQTVVLVNGKPCTDIVKDISILASGVNLYRINIKNGELIITTTNDTISHLYIVDNIISIGTESPTDEPVADENEIIPLIEKYEEKLQKVNNDIEALQKEGIKDAGAVRAINRMSVRASTYETFIDELKETL